MSESDELAKADQKVTELKKRIARQLAKGSALDIPSARCTATGNVLSCLAQAGLSLPRHGTGFRACGKRPPIAAAGFCYDALTAAIEGGEATVQRREKFFWTPARRIWIDKSAISD
jgi:hypothetical protein